jgi:RNA polymerase sigma-70 factor (ECF subfamily)
LNIENDKDIVELYQSGETERAATALVRKYQKFVYATAYRLLHDYDEADDAAQDVFIKAVNNLNGFKNLSTLKTWLYRITYNTCINRIRKNKLMFWRSSSESELLMKTDAEYDADKELAEKENAQLLLDAVAKLPLKQREIFALRYFEDLKYDEIAEMVGKSVGGLKSNYFHAVKKLTAMLKKNYE